MFAILNGQGCKFTRTVGQGYIMPMIKACNQTLIPLQTNTLRGIIEGRPQVELLAACARRDIYELAYEEELERLRLRYGIGEPWAMIDERAT